MYKPGGADSALPFKSAITYQKKLGYFSTTFTIPAGVKKMWVDMGRAHSNGHSGEYLGHGGKNIGAYTHMDCTLFLDKIKHFRG